MYLKLRKNKLSEVSIGNFDNRNWKKTGYIILITILLFIPGMKNVYGCAPTANFSVDNTTPVVGETVKFTDSSSNNGGGGINQWSWNFGSGASPATANIRGPHNVIYTTSGQKNVALTVTSSDGSDTNTKSNFINVGIAPTAGAIGTSHSILYGAIPNALTSTLDGGGSGTISYEWQTNTSGTFVTIGGATAAGYQPPALTKTTSYQRRTVAVYGGKTRNSDYTAAVTITVVNPSVTASVPNYSDASCYGQSNGSITIHAGGGMAPYSYSVDNGAHYTLSNTDPYTISGLQANIPYQIRVKDANNFESPAIP